LREFAATVAAALPATAQGVRYAGDPDGRVERVAVVGGSGDSFFDAVRASGVDAYVTADLRHHPTSELRERAEHGDTGPSTPYLVDVAHFASEWPWLELAARTLAQDAAAAGTTVETRVSTVSTDPWTGRVASPDAPRALEPTDSRELPEGPP
jgi:putative NIF3 family GTP cyclohydrolase 1 type 2